MKSTHAGRRRFMLTLGLGGAAATTVAVSRKDAAPQQGAVATDKGAAGGYRLTEHIQNYYRTTRV